MTTPYRNAKVLLSQLFTFANSYSDEVSDALRLKEMRRIAQELELIDLLRLAREAALTEAVIFLQEQSQHYRMIADRCENFAREPAAPADCMRVHLTEALENRKQTWFYDTCITSICKLRDHPARSN